MWDRDRNFLTEPPAAHPIPPSSNHHSHHHHHHHHLQPLVCGWRHSTSQTPSSSYGPTFSAPVILTQHITMSHWTNNASNKIFLSYIQKKNSNKLNFIPYLASLTSYISPSKTRSVCDWNVAGLTCIVYGLTREGPFNTPLEEEEEDATYICVYIHIYIYSGSSELQRSALLQMNILYWLNILQSAAWVSTCLNGIPFPLIAKFLCSLQYLG